MKNEKCFLRETFKSWTNKKFPFFLMQNFDHSKASLEEISVAYDLLIYFGCELDSPNKFNNNPQLLSLLTQKLNRLATIIEKQAKP